MKLFNLYNETMFEVQEMNVYFGENRNSENPEEIFKIFAEFVRKFEASEPLNYFIYVSSLSYFNVTQIVLFSESSSAKCHHKTPRKTALEKQEPEDGR